MSKKSNKEDSVKCCFECDHCLYIGEGDHICDVNNEVITSDWEPTEKFYCCGGKEFEER